MTVADYFESRLARVERANVTYSVAAESYSSDLTVVRAVGDLDLNASADLQRALQQASRDETVVLLDLSAVSFMYSGAAHVVIDAAARGGGRLEVFAPTRPARVILEAMGAATIVTDPRRN